MSPNMALNQTNKLVWIVETIYRAHKISFEELNRRWMDNVRYDIIIANGDRQVILDTLSESLC